MACLLLGKISYLNILALQRNYLLRDCNKEVTVLMLIMTLLDNRAYY